MPVDQDVDLEKDMDSEMMIPENRSSDECTVDACVTVSKFPQ